MNAKIQFGEDMNGSVYRSLWTSRPPLSSIPSLPFVSSLIPSLSIQFTRAGSPTSRTERDVDRERKWEILLSISSSFHGIASLLINNPEATDGRW